MIIDDKCKDQFNFEDIIGSVESVGAEQDIDLSRLTFIEPYSMLSLLLLGRNHLRNTGEKHRLVNIPLSIHQYLTRMDFFHTGVFETDRPLDEKFLLKRSAFSKRVIEVTEIPNKERESVKVIGGVIEKFRKRAGFILKNWISETITDLFVTVISELCQNIFEHSLDSGYLSMQTYTAGKENIVRLVISDSGIGIRGSFDQKKEVIYDSPANLIEKAFTTPISSKREFGYGLCEVNAIVEMLKGSIFIRSANASVTALYNKKNKGQPLMFLKNDLKNFRGTQISISLSY